MITERLWTTPNSLHNTNLRSCKHQRTIHGVLLDHVGLTSHGGLINRDTCKRGCQGLRMQQHHQSGNNLSQIHLPKPSTSSPSQGTASPALKGRMSPTTTVNTDWALASLLRRTYPERGGERGQPDALLTLNEVPPCMHWEDNVSPQLLGPF